MLHIAIREQRTSFDSDAVSAMTAAYDAILRELGLSECDDATTRLVAKLVIGFGSEGERDPQRIEIAILGALSAQGGDLASAIKPQPK
jgi:hypothetical protein